ncbi:MAG: class I SAM-dependent methyltransferase [Acidobacteriota bacterium]
MGHHPARTNKPVDDSPYGESVIPIRRVNFLVAKCKETLQQTPGNVLEVGVYKGGTLIALCAALKEVCPQFRVYGIDTFTGHPYTDGHPVHPQGKYGDVDMAKLERLIVSRGLKSWVKLYRGRVEDVFQGLQLANVSFAHIDCDLYAPVKYCAENVPGVMNRRGVLYFDDYGHEHCPGATRAVEEVFSSTDLQEVHISEDNTCWSCYLKVPPGE